MRERYTSMNKMQRRFNMLTFINDHGIVTFEEIKDYFPDVSDMTLRTDLKELNEEKKIIRVRGGAKSIHETTKANDLYYQRLTRNHDKKQQIAKKAITYLVEQLSERPNLTIYLDPGSTVSEIAKHFPDEWCTIVTNSISSAYALSSLKKPTVIVTGGTLNRYNCCCDNAKNINMLEKMNFDITFYAVAGYSEKEGFTCVKEIYDEIREVVKSHSKKIIIPIDSTKIGVVYPITHIRLEEVDMIISDDDLPEKTRKYFEDHNVTVL